MNDRLDELTLMYLDGQLAPADLSELTALMRGDAACRDRFCELVVRSGALRELKPAQRVQGSGFRVQGKKVRSLEFGVRSWIALAALVMLAATAWFLLPSVTPHSALRTPQSQPVAMLTDLQGDAIVETGDTRTHPGDGLNQGVIRLNAGSAQLMFNSGAVVDLIGPCAFELIDDNRGRLSRGTLHALVRAEARGFTVMLPGGRRVVDEGTEFGLYVNDHRQTELYVYQGQVRLDAPDALASTVHTLTAGEARRIDADGAVTSIRLSTARFAPGLIDNVDIPIDLAEWTLPETLGQWTLNNIEGASVAGDQLAGRAGAGDPHAQDAMIFRTDLHIEGSRYPYIEVQLAADADSGGAELFWGVAGQGMFAAGRSVRFGGSDGRMKTYVIDMSRELRWSNQRITGLRLDPVSGKDHAGFKLRNVRLLASLPYAMDQLRPVHAKFNVPGIPVYQRIEPTPGSVKEQEP